MINVTEIYDQINGFGGVCFPIKDAADNWVLDESTLQDDTISEIHPLIDSCPRIDYNAIVIEEK